ncbi:hypothetical protein RUM8411_00594 [Ruegeria meonggei]|uniref:Uncharacterized protein n=1 Tax=Ruegeria meonggei TaxID=1446476 RepID=A0A1X6YEK4_9RHOB|nr:hypothetical protein RUM8411_00594 [Ruegeria meonggei]
MPFSAKVQHVFSIPDKGTVLWLTEVSGDPVECDRFGTEIGDATVLLVDKLGIRDRNCLTGKKVPRYGGVLTDLPMSDAMRLYETTVQTVEEES